MEFNFSFEQAIILDPLHVLLLFAVCALGVSFYWFKSKQKPIVPNERMTVNLEAGKSLPDESADSKVADLLQLDPKSALQLLSIFQQEARLLDFLQEDITHFDDAEVGAVARVVHEGGQKVLQQYFQLSPIRSEDEESAVTLAQDEFSAQAIRLTGKVSNQAPFTGVLVHKGWRVAVIKLPKLAEGHDPYIVAPAEVEL